MTRRTILMAGAVIAVLVLVIVLFAVLRKPEVASGPLAAPTLAVTVAAPTAAVAPTLEPTATAPAAAATTEPVATPTPEPTAIPLQPVVFEIVQAESEARFSLGELLRGNPNTVVGVTDQVAGQLSVDLSYPDTTQVGQIVVNARTLVTDNEFRNRAISNQILDTNQYELITFTPTELIGLPEKVQVGDTVSFQMAGDLTIRDTTQSVTFDVSLTITSADRLEGSAQATVRRSDYGLIIPQVPGVASVDEEVLLEIDFVAMATGG